MTIKLIIKLVMYTIFPLLSGAMIGAAINTWATRVLFATMVAIILLEAASILPPAIGIRHFSEIPFTREPVDPALLPSKAMVAYVAGLSIPFIFATALSFFTLLERVIGLLRPGTAKRRWPPEAGPILLPGFYIAVLLAIGDRKLIEAFSPLIIPGKADAVTNGLWASGLFALTYATQIFGASAYPRSWSEFLGKKVPK